MKAIALVDVPKRCDVCKLCVEERDSLGDPVYKCVLLDMKKVYTPTYIDQTDKKNIHIDSRCPLKPYPYDKDIQDSVYYDNFAGEIVTKKEVTALPERYVKLSQPIFKAVLGYMGV